MEDNPGGNHFYDGKIIGGYGGSPSVGDIDFDGLDEIVNCNN